MKIKLLFAFIGVIMLQKSALAQQSILGDISETYLDKLVAVAKANYPTVHANQHRVEAAKANVTRTSLSYFDAFSLSYVYQPQGFLGISAAGAGSTTTTGTGTTGTSGNYGTFNGIQVGITVNLGAFIEKPASVKMAKKDLAIATDVQEEYLLTLTNNVKRRYYLYIQDIADLKLATAASVNAQEVLTAVKHKFEVGEETFENYNRALLTLNTSNQAKIMAESNVLIAKSDLEELLGEKLEEVK